ncbi:hypothetical protein ACSBR1_001217 [Camellia fascicularis]
MLVHWSTESLVIERLDIPATESPFVERDSFIFLGEDYRELEHDELSPVKTMKITRTMGTMGSLKGTCPTICDPPRRQHSTRAVEIDDPSKYSSHSLASTTKTSSFGRSLDTSSMSSIGRYISNSAPHHGTIFEHIHNEIKAFNISWHLQIATETTEVLSYFDYTALIPIIHGDVKFMNILLDDDYTAKVSDFGTSRLVALDQDQLVAVVQGTIRYLDPEYMLTSQLTKKS